MMESSFKNQIIAQNRALEGKQEKQVITNEHYVHKRPIAGPFQDSLEEIILGLGCFWGAEKKILESRWCVHYRSWLFRRLYTKSNL